MKRKRIVVCGIFAAVLALAFTACRGPVESRPATGSIAGSVVFPSGSDGASISIDLKTMEGLLAASVDVTYEPATDGSFRFDGLDPGVYALYVSLQDSLERSRMRTVTVTAGGVYPLGAININLGCGCGTIPPPCGCTHGDAGCGCDLGGLGCGCTHGDVGCGCTHGDIGCGCTHGDASCGCDLGGLGCGCTYGDVGCGCTHGDVGCGCTYGDVGCGCYLGDLGCGCTHGDVGCGCTHGDVGCGCTYGDVGCGCYLGDLGCGCTHGDVGCGCTHGDIGCGCTYGDVGCGCYLGDLGCGCTYGDVGCDCMRGDEGCDCAPGLATGITLSRTDPLYLYLGDTYLLFATVGPEDTTNRMVVWASSNLAIVSVVESMVPQPRFGISGPQTAVRIRANGEGTATITATAMASSNEELIATLTVTVEAHDCDRDGHVWGIWVETTGPTCTTAGVETRICAECGEAHTRPGSAALGHDWGNWETTKPATAGGYGEETRTCQRCGESETRPTPPLGFGLGGFEISFAAFRNMAPGADITGLSMSILTPLTITVTEAGSASIRWLVGDEEIGRGAGITLNRGNFHNNQIRTHFLTLVAEVGGREYSRRIAIDVTP